MRGGKCICIFNSQPQLLTHPLTTTLFHPGLRGAQANRAWCYLPSTSWMEVFFRYASSDVIMPILPPLLPHLRTFVYPTFKVNNKMYARTHTFFV